MHAYVYKSQRKQDTYLYLAHREGFDAVPEALRQPLGTLTFVLEVALTPGRRLARVDADEVRTSLAARGFYLQWPPQLDAPVEGRDGDG